MIRFAWGVLVGLVLGGVLALTVFADPLCRGAVNQKVQGLLDGLGLPRNSGVRRVAEDAIFN